MPKEQVSCDCRAECGVEGDPREGTERLEAAAPARTHTPAAVAGGTAPRPARRTAPGAASIQRLNLPPPRWIRAGVLGGLTAGATLLGCIDSNPTGPGAGAPTQEATFRITPELQAAFDAALSDADQRLVPALGEAAGRHELAAALTTLDHALATRSRPALTEAIQAAERAIVELGRGSDAEAIALHADLDAVRLILARAGRLLSPSAE